MMIKFDKSKTNRVLYDVLTSVLAGVTLSLLFFIFSDFLFITPDLNGKWSAQVYIEDADKESYKGLTLLYEVIFIQKGNEIYGSGEKIGEVSSTQDTCYYTRSCRPRIEVEGYLDQNYFSKDKLIIHSLESGQVRETSTFFNLLKFDQATMSGSYVSTASNASGGTKWIKTLSSSGFD